MLYEGDIQIYNIIAPTDPEVFTTELLTTTEQQTTEPLATTQTLTTTEYLTTMESISTTEPLTTTEPPTITELTSTTEPPTSIEMTSTPEPPTTTVTQAPITTMLLTTEQSGTIKDQTDNMNPPATTMASPPLTVEDENATTSSDVDAHTWPTTTMLSTKRITTMPEGSTSIISTTMDEPITTTESLGKDIEHTTSSGQVITIGVVPDKENDASIVIVDSNLATIGIYTSASSLALFFALAIIVIAMIVVMVVLLCRHKRKAKESESANTELTRMREFTSETMKSKHTSNIYTSPTHNHHSSEVKLDLM
jgi:hypothetical protein